MQKNPRYSRVGGTAIERGALIPMAEDQVAGQACNEETGIFGHDHDDKTTAKSKPLCGRNQENIDNMVQLLGLSENGIPPWHC